MNSMIAKYRLKKIAKKVNAQPHILAHGPTSLDHVLNVAEMDIMASFDVAFGEKLTERQIAFRNDLTFIVSKRLEEVRTVARQHQSYARFWMQVATGIKDVTYDPSYLNWEGLFNKSPKK